MQRTAKEPTIVKTNSLLQTCRTIEWVIQAADYSVRSCTYKTINIMLSKCLGKVNNISAGKSVLY